MSKMLAGIIAVLLVAVGARAGDYFEVECKLCKGDPKGSKEAGTLKTVAASTMIAPSNQSAKLLVGGQVPIGTGLVPVGQEVEVVASTADNGAIKVHVVLRLHSQVGRAGAPQVTTVSEETKATVRPGGSARVAIGKDPRNQQWVDVTVRPLK
jgi:hypothetical protein